MSGEPIKLTKLQREVLEALKSGALITLGERALQAQTRYFLTENRLITRQDKTRSAEAKGNGFTISPKGLTLLNVNDHSS